MTTHAHQSRPPDHITDYLPAYLNGTLALAGPDAPTHVSIAAHLSDSPACRRELAAWTAIAEALPPPTATATPPSGALDALLAAIESPPWQLTWPEISTPRRTRPDRPIPDPIALRPPMPADRHPWTRIGGLGLIAAVLILIATVAITSAPDSEPPRLPAIAAASPAATAPSDPAAPSVSVQIVPDAIDIAECTTQSRPPGTVAHLRATHGGTPESWLTSSGLDPDLERPAPATEVMTGIEGMLRQLVACRFFGMATLGADSYDLDSRHLALFSERYVVELAMHMEGRGFRIPFRPNDSAPLPIIDAAQYPDGSVLVRLGDVPGYGQGTIYLLLVLEHGNWAIDDWRNSTFASGPNDPATPASSEMPGVVPIIATDDLAGAWNQSPDDELRTATDVILTIANLGDAPVRFEIPGLGFATDIAAGHSLDLVVNAPAGTYPLDLAHPGSPDMLDAELVLIPDP